jgi:hypothetical protein
MRNAFLPSGLLLAMVSFACSKDETLPEAETRASAEAPTLDSPVPSGAVAVAPPARPGAPPSCTVSSEKVWTESPSLATGITPTVLDDGRVAVGVALGGRPHVVVFDAEGQGEVVAMPLAGALRDGVHKGGKRVIGRVTPGVGSGGALVAFADYHDDYPDRRHVACGPTDSAQSPLVFDGKPLLHRAASEAEEESERAGAPAPAPVEPAPAPAPADPAPIEPVAAPSVPSAEAAADEKEEQGPGSKQLPSLRSRSGTRAEALRAAVAERKARAKAGAAADTEAKPAAPAPAPAPKAAGPSGDPPSKELRTCRTFLDTGGRHAWFVGSELQGQPQKDGSFDYKMVLFAAREHGRGREVLHEQRLGADPQKVETYDALAARETSPGRFVLTTRYRGTLHGLTLDSERRRVGSVKVYTGGYPSMARFAEDRTPLVLASQRVSGNFGLRLLRVGDDGALPQSVEDIVVLGGEPSKTEPSFARVGDHRYLSYVAGAPGRRSLHLVTVGEDFAALAPPLTIAQSEEVVLDSHVLPLASGRVLAVYLRSPGGRAALVSKVLTCG